MNCYKSWIICVFLICVTVAYVVHSFVELEIRTTEMMLEAKYKRIDYNLGSIVWEPTR